MAPHRAIIVRAGREPFEVAFLLAATTVGLVLIAGPERPASVRAAMPVLVQTLWEWGLFGLGLLGLLGLLLQGRRLAAGLLVEGAAMALGSSALTMYGIALFAVAGARAAAAGGFVLAFAIGALFRLVRIVHDARLVVATDRAGDVPERCRNG